MSAHSSGAALPLVPAQLPEPEWGSWLLRIAAAVNRLLRGKMNAVATVTLTAGATSTTLTDSRIGFFSSVQLEAATASAATARLTAPGIYVVPGNGSAVIHHPNNAAVDQTFSALIIG